MSNNAYLTCARKCHTYPSSQETDFDPDEQTVAYCSYCVPLLWWALFRPKDIRVDEIECDGVVLREPAPVVHRKYIAGRLEEAVPRIERLFANEGAFREHVAMLRQAIESIDEAYPYATIEMQEIGWLIEAGFDSQVEEILHYMAGTDLSDARQLLGSMSAIHVDRPFPPPSDFGKKDLPREDWENLARLLGDELCRDLPWMSLLPRSEEMPELIAAIRRGDLDTVCRLLAEGHDPNIASASNHGTPLHEAVRNLEAVRNPQVGRNSEGAVEPLLKAGAKVTDHIMVDAAYSASAATLARLIKAGGNPNARAYGEDKPALSCACADEHDRVEKVRLLLAAGAAPNAWYGVYTRPLEESLYRRALDVAEILVDVTDSEGRTRAMKMAEGMKRPLWEFIDLFEKHGIARTQEAGWGHDHYTKNNATPCPHCGKELRTANAKQCFHCGKSWH